jgi:hypothetical protein
MDIYIYMLLSSWCLRWVHASKVTGSGLCCIGFKITLPIYITSFSPTFQACAISYSIFSTFTTTRQLSQPCFWVPIFFAYTHRIDFPQLMFLQYMLKHVWTSLNYVCYVLLSVLHSIWPLGVISNICSYAITKSHLPQQCPQLIASGPSGPSRGAEEVSWLDGCRLWILCSCWSLPGDSFSPFGG